MALLFSDNFSSFANSPDGSVGWETQGEWNQRDLNQNYLDTYFSDSSVGVNPYSVANGVLNITANPISPSLTPKGDHYTSGMITTEGSLNFEYGMIEVTAKMPSGAGMWPVIWMVGSAGWPPEIDIMERLSDSLSNIYLSTHSSVAGGTQTQGYDTGFDTSAGFHTYGVDWEPDTITWYVDGKAVASEATPADMHQPMYLLIDNGVSSAASGVGVPTGPSEFPQTMSISSVKFYSTPATTDVYGTAVASATNTNGVAVDGPISGATVFADAQGTGVYAPGDVSTTTDAQGRFSLDGGIGPLVLTGGVDTSTGEAFQGMLSAPAGSTVITPLTTLVNDIAGPDANSVEVAAAEGEVASALGVDLEGGQSLLTLDPYSGTLADDAGATSAYVVGAEVMDTGDFLGGRLAGLSGGEASAGFSAVLNAIAAAVHAAGGAVDLTSASTLEGVIEAAAAALGIPSSELSATTVADLAQTAASNNSQLLTGAKGLTGAAAVAMVSQAEAESTSPAPCFCPGTLIETDAGLRPVEHLVIGDKVRVAGGGTRAIKWIGQRAYAGLFAQTNANLQPVCVRAGALADRVPTKDLWISPEHALLLDGVLVPAGRLVNGISIVRASGLADISYFNIEFDAHDVLFADGAPAESFADDGSRCLFNNAAEYFLLYPDERPKAEAEFCAPRLEDGPDLMILTRRLEARARRLGADGVASPVRIRGFLDSARGDVVEGWAQDLERPSRAVSLLVLCDGVVVAETEAGLHRPDLEAAGVGDGRHAFSVRVPPRAGSGSPRVVEVRCADDFALLPRRDAAISVARARAEPGPLVGMIDRASRARVTGWVRDLSNADERVALLVRVDGSEVARVSADRFRQDLLDAGQGDGRHAFEAVLPERLDPEKAQVLEIVRAVDGAQFHPPVTLSPGGFGDGPLEAAISDALGRHLGGADEARLLEALLRETDRLIGKIAARATDEEARRALTARRRRWGAGNPAADCGGPKPLALFIDRTVPDPARDAGAHAVVSHMRGLKALGRRLMFAAAEGWSGDPPPSGALPEDLEVELCRPPFHSCVEDVLVRCGRSLEIVYLHRVETAAAYLPLVRRHAPQARLVFSLADLKHLRLRRQARAEGRLELAAAAACVERQELLAASEADVILTHSSFEAELLKRRLPGARVCVAPFEATLRPPPPAAAARGGFAFVGSMAHAPNRDAVERLTSVLLPLVWREAPETTCSIIGSGWEGAGLGDLDQRLRVLGPVDDLGAAFASARLTLAPLRFGAGIKGKVLESFGAGIPCVLSETAAEGLPPTPAVAALTTRSDADFAALAVSLHRDGSLNEALGAEVRALAAAEYGRAAVREALADALGLGRDGAFVARAKAGVGCR